MISPRIVLIGAVESTQVAFEALLRSGCKLELLISLPVDRSSIHSDFVDLAALAASHDVPFIAAGNVNAAPIVEQIRQLQPDYIFVIGWSRLVGAELRGCAGKGVLGYHPAPLPKGRGRSALAWTILLDMQETAGSLFWIDEGVDAGPIAAQQYFAIPAQTSLPQLMDLHMRALGDMLEKLLSQLAAGEIPAVVQDAGQATYFALRRPEDGLIDWSQSAEALDRLVRSLARPYPGAFTYYGGRRMIIWRGQPVDAPEWHAQTGQVFQIVDDSLMVRCGDGSSYRIDEYEVMIEPGEALVRLKGQPRLGAIGTMVNA